MELVITPLEAFTVITKSLPKSSRLALRLHLEVIKRELKLPASTDTQPEFRPGPVISDPTTDRSWVIHSPFGSARANLQEVATLFYLTEGSARTLTKGEKVYEKVIDDVTFTCQRLRGERRQAMKDQDPNYQKLLEAARPAKSTRGARF